ncbi:hypothetical protein F5X99DRAFT_406405 [Biscogniauxia marginata]|nr:hypothetical protein F5X99DRAFT_406405 [Biscogniauxia marginata]
MSLRKFTVVAALALASLTSAANLEVPSQAPVLNQDTVHGCYKSLGTLKLDSNPDFNSQGKCVGICKGKSKNVAATNSDACYCGDVYPNSNDVVDDSECTEPCPGFDTQACGGLNVYTVYNTGLRVSVGEADESSSSSSSSSSTSTSTSTTSAAATAGPVTQTSDSDSGSGGGTNTVGIVVGVVIAVLVIAGLAGGAFFWMRRKRNAEIEEEHRRNAAVNAFISGGGKPGSSGGVSMADARMDPVMNRRMSDGSIADNQDYSRRILRVTNA